MINIKQIKSDIEGPIIFQGPTGLKRSTEFFFNETSSFMRVPSMLVSTDLGLTLSTARIDIQGSDINSAPFRIQPGITNSSILMPQEGMFNVHGTDVSVYLGGIWKSLGSDKFTSDITVSLSGGKTLGKYTNGQTIPSTGLSAQEVLNLIAIEDIAPTYTPASLSFTKSAATRAEVGTPYSGNTLTAVFNRNDAGILTSIRIQKNGADITPNGTTSPFVKVDSGSYVLGNINFAMFVNYNAGIIKNYFPSGTPDARTPLIRNANAPQAAENNFSTSFTLNGAYLIFYGPASSIPTTSTDVRSLGTNRYTDSGNIFILNTGSTQVNFSVCMPSSMSLVEVLDLDALNANITAGYILTNFNVNDAGGNAVSYKIYTMTNALAYSANHRHQITVA